MVQIATGFVEPPELPSFTPIQLLPPTPVAQTMMQTQQNMQLLAFLRSTPHEVDEVLKGLDRFALPTRDPTTLARQLELADFIPRSPEDFNNRTIDIHLRHLALVLASSHLLLIAQVFRCMPVTFSDDGELSRLIDGVNRILISLGDNIGIVSHALVGESLIVIKCATTSEFNFSFDVGNDTIPKALLVNIGFYTFHACLDQGLLRITIKGIPGI